MTCDELRDQYELYALGVLEEPERAELKDHLRDGCLACTAGMNRARETVAVLSSLAPPRDPPVRLRRKVLALAGVPARSVWSWIPALAAAFLLLLAVGLAIREERLASDLAAARNQVRQRAAELARLNEALALVTSTETKAVGFGAGAPQPPHGRVFLNPAGVLLIASNLPPAPTGKIYEMWVIPKAGKPEPAGLFQSSQDGTALHLLKGTIDLASTSAVAVTLESEGGAEQPTSKPLIVAAL